MQAIWQKKRGFFQKCFTNTVQYDILYATTLQEKEKET